MILITGGIGSGRHTYVSQTLKIDSSMVHEISDEDLTLYENNRDYVYALLSYPYVITQEKGCGVIPLQKEDRIKRELNGRLNCILAEHAVKVILMICGIAKCIKQKDHTRSCMFVMFRHGSTFANVEKQFAGRYTDLPLCDKGFADLKDGEKKLKQLLKYFYPPVANKILNPDCVYTSTLQRTVESAAFIYPDAKIIKCSGLCEYDFGLFEGRTHKDLINDENTKYLYQSWLDNYPYGKTPPGKDSAGESFIDFSERVKKEFRNLYESKSTIDNVFVFVAHGGVQSVCKYLNYSVSGQSESGSFIFGELLQ